MEIFLLILLLSISVFCLFSLVKYFYLNSNVRWLAQRREHKMQRLLKAFYLWIYKGHIPRKDFSVMLRCHSRRLASRVLAQLSELTMGHIPMRLERYVAWKKIDKFLLKTAKRTHGLKRAVVVKTLYLLPLPRWSEFKVVAFENDKNNFVRLYALLSHLEYDFKRSVDILHEFKGEYSPLDYCVIAMYFHRHVMAQDFYLSLLRHEDERLQMLSLYIIRMMNIRPSGAEIIKQMPSHSDNLNYMMLKTLVVIHYDLNHLKVVEMISSLPSEKRKYLYRLASVEGYSLGALSRVLEAEKHAFMVDYVVGLIQGGKYRLV